MKYEVILLRNKMRGKITQYYFFYQTLSINVTELEMDRTTSMPKSVLRLFGG